MSEETRNSIRIGLTVEQRRGVAEMMNALLADEFVLGVKTKNYHWNVKGPQFHDLHNFFEAQYGALEEKIDEIAEFARYMGEPALGSMSAFLEKARLQEDTETARGASEMISNLLKDHEEVIRNLRTGIETAEEKWGSAEAADFFTGLVQEHEKMAWMLRAMLE